MRFVTVAVFEAIPGLGRVYSSGDLARAAVVRAEIMLLTWLAGTVAGSTILIWNNAFLRLWVGPEYSASYVTTLLIVVMVMQFAWIRVDGNFINLTLELKEKVALGAVSAVLSLTLAIAFVRELDMGIAGVCWGFILGRLILSVWYPVILGKAFQVSVSSQLRGVVRPALVTLLLYGGLSRLGSVDAVDTWVELLVAVPASSAVLLGVTFFAGFSSAQRLNTYDRVGVALRGGGRS
jgi:O-antigen/teichoic acid export membrane protein